MTVQRNDDRPTQAGTDPDPPRCGNCDGIISQEDVICPHCGVSLAGG